MILLLWGAVLSTLTATVAPLVAYLVRITCGISQYEIQLRKDILDLKKVQGTGNERCLTVRSFTAVAPLVVYVIYRKKTRKTYKNPP
jgi:hypothetical protein